MKSDPRNAPIGIFDSGVGGLSVLRVLRAQLPQEDIVYFADQIHVPYGPRPIEQVRYFSEQITHYLCSQGVKLIVIACNTASAAALYHLRNTIPNMPFVGMEPAVKPAAETTRSGVVGVLATPATFQGALYASVVERFANGVIVLQNTCPGLVALIEQGEISSPKTKTILENALYPMIEKGIDRVVMGCTHYPFVIPIIKEIVGPNVEVIDPAPAIARQTLRLLKQSELLKESMTGAGSVRYVATGNPEHLRELIHRYTGEKGIVEVETWEHLETLRLLYPAQ